jgi:hypothetical protein
VGRHRGVTKGSGDALDALPRVAFDFVLRSVREHLRNANPTSITSAIAANIANQPRALRPGEPPPRPAVSPTIGGAASQICRSAAFHILCDAVPRPEQSGMRTARSRPQTRSWVPEGLPYRSTRPARRGLGFADGCAKPVHRSASSAARSSCSPRRMH